VGARVECCCTSSMTDSFLAAAAHRCDDAVLHMLARHFLLADGGGKWAVEHRAGAGRCLVATEALEAGHLVFTERPLAVASPCSSSALAREILAQVKRAAPDSEHLRALRLLQAEGSGEFFALSMKSAESALPESTPEDARAAARWARGIAHVNTHAAGERGLGTERAVLGLLSSMMPHECLAACVVRIGESGGSPISLHTVRHVAKGEVLSISYCFHYLLRERRRELLLKQHGFVCECKRCTQMPELVRAFQCPNPQCGEGPCSPASPAPSCRELHCDSCEATMALDDDAWAQLTKLELSSSVDECMQVCHPFHHTMVTMYGNNLDKLPDAARAQVLLQFASARGRLLGDSHPLVARDIEGAALAMHAAGEAEQSIATFADAADRYSACFGPACDEAMRCRARSAAA